MSIEPPAEMMKCGIASGFVPRYRGTTTRPVALTIPCNDKLLEFISSKFIIPCSMLDVH